MSLTSTAVSPGLFGCLSVPRSDLSRSANVFSMSAYWPSSVRSSCSGRLNLESDTGTTRGRAQEEGELGLELARLDEWLRYEDPL